MFHFQHKSYGWVLDLSLCPALFKSCNVVRTEFAHVCVVCDAPASIKCLHSPWVCICMHQLCFKPGFVGSSGPPSSLSLIALCLSQLLAFTVSSPGQFSLLPCGGPGLLVGPCHWALPCWALPSGPPRALHRGSCGSLLCQPGESPMHRLGWVS